MDKNSEYINLMKCLDNLSSDAVSLSEEEKGLLDDLLVIIRTDRRSKIIKKVFGDSVNFNSLLQAINTVIKKYSEEITKIREDSLSINQEQVNILMDRITKLNDLRNSIIDFCNRQYMINEVDVNKLIDKCGEALRFRKGDNPKYFGREIVSVNDSDYNNRSISFYLDRDLVSFLYKVLEDTTFMDQVDEGVEILNQEEKYKTMLSVCREAFDYKDSVYSNILDIVAYNNTNNRLNEIICKKNNPKYKDVDKKIDEVESRIKNITRGFFKKLIHKREYKKLQEEKLMLQQVKRDYFCLINENLDLEDKSSDLKRKLTHSGLRGLFVSHNTGNYSLLNFLDNIYSIQDVDNYYSYLEDMSSVISDIIKENNTCKIDFVNRVSKDIVNFIDNYPETACNLSLLRKSEGDISPRMALFILNSYIVCSNSSIFDLNIEDDEYNECREYYDKIIKSRYQKFKEEFLNVLNGLDDISKADGVDKSISFLVK